MNGWPLGELGNTVFIIAFIGLWLALIFFGDEEKRFSLPKDGEGWVWSIWLTAVPALCLGLLVGILTDSLYDGSSTGGEPAPDTISDIYRDRRQVAYLALSYSEKRKAVTDFRT